MCRKAGISHQTYYRWRKKYGSLMPSEMRRLKQLEEEPVDDGGAVVHQAFTVAVQGLKIHLLGGLHRH